MTSRPAAELSRERRRLNPAVLRLLSPPLIGSILLWTFWVAPGDQWVPPNFDHPFGTDEFGRDLLATALAATGLSLLKGIVITAGALVASIVAAELARRCEVTLSYAIGVAQPTSINVDTFGTGTVPDEAILAAVRKHFDLRPGAIIRDLDLRRPLFRATAAYGHFGRTGLDVPWEDTGRAADVEATARRGG